MRVLFFARSKRRTGVTRHIAEGLREAGHVVNVIRPRRWTALLGQTLARNALLAASRHFNPDLVLVLNWHVPAAVLARLAPSCTTALWCLDCFDEPPSELIERARLVDFLLLTNDGQAEFYRRLGIKSVVYMPQGISPTEHRPCAAPDPAYSGDLAFIGRLGPQPRQDLLLRLDREFNLKIWGPSWGGLDATFRGIQHRAVRTRQFAEVCAASKIIIGCDIAHDVELYFSNRTWITLGCGGFLLTSYSPRLETIFENRKHLVWYNSADECVELARYYLAHAEERRRIARAGCEYAHRDHTYRHRAEALGRLVHGVTSEDAEKA